jgi:hypothetical protein
MLHFIVESSIQKMFLYKDMPSKYKIEWNTKENMIKWIDNEVRENEKTKNKSK